VTYKWGPDIKPPSYIPVGDLAESWDQPDETSYVFKLRSGVKWHNVAPVNGRDLTADDIAYSFQRIQDQKTYAQNLGGATKFEAVDKGTFKLTLAKPNPDVLASLAAVTMAIVPKERVEQTSGKLDDPPLIGTGPFIFSQADYNMMEVFKAKKNPDYFVKGTPYVESYEHYRTTDVNFVLNGYRSATLNLIGGGMTAQSGEDMLKAVPKSSILWVPLDRNPSEFAVNSAQEPFTDIRVRQAISKAIDRKGIIDTVHLGRAQLSSGLSFPDPSWSLSQDEMGKTLARDVEGAKKLLKDAGKENLSFKILAANYLQGAYVTMAEQIVANLKDIGIIASVDVADTTTSIQRQSSGTFQAYCLALGGSTLNAWLAARYHSTGPQNYAKYNNPQLDKLIEQQSTITKDTEARKKIVQDIQRTILNDAVYMTLHVYQQPVLAQPELKDVAPPIGVNSHSLFWSTIWIDK
jgi:ABC-type transport system substrate-binding protein